MPAIRAVRASDFGDVEGGDTDTADFTARGLLSCRCLDWPVERPAIEANLAQDESITDYAHVAAEGDGHWYTLHTTDTTIDTIGESLLNADGFLLGAAQIGVAGCFEPGSSSEHRTSFRDTLVAVYNIGSDYH